MTDFNSRSCNATLKNTGRCGCDQVITGIEYVTLALKTQVFSTKTLAETEATWLTDIQLKKLYPTYQLHTVEDASTEDGTFSGANGLVVIPTSKGRWIAKFMFQIPAYNMTRLYSFNGFSGRIYLHDALGHTLGTTNGTTFKGFEIRRVQVGKPTLPLTKDDVMSVPMTVEFVNIDEYTSLLGVIDTPFADTLEGLQNATVTYVSSNVAKTDHTVTVTRECDSTGISGLVLADFQINDDTPSAELITSATESTTVPGTYVLVTAALGADNYTVDLVSAATMTTKGYESTGADTFVIS